MGLSSDFLFGTLGRKPPQKGPSLVMGQWFRHGRRVGCRRQRTVGLGLLWRRQAFLHVRRGQYCRGGWALEGPAEGQGHCRLAGTGTSTRAVNVGTHLRSCGTRNTHTRSGAGDHLTEVRGDNPVSKANRTQTTAPRQEPWQAEAILGDGETGLVPTDHVNFESVECKAWTARKRMDF